MKLVALSDIFVKGQPAQRGERFNAEGEDVRFLVDSRLARHLTTEEVAADDAAIAAAELPAIEPAVEVAAAAPEVETGSTVSAKRTRSKVTS